jgi:hypothetical protein
VGGFAVSDDLLRRLLQVYACPLPQDAKMIFFGLRGCVPAVPEDLAFAEARVLKLAPVNYQNPRCVLGQMAARGGQGRGLPRQHRADGAVCGRGGG